MFFFVEAASFILTFTLEEEERFPHAKRTSFAVFKSVDFKTPEPGQPCTVTAEITIEQADSGRETTEIATANLIYYVDGESEASLPMKPIADGRWTADIPSQKHGARVDFYIYILDTNGNVTSGAVPFKDALVPLPPELDDPTGTTPDTLNINEFAAGYDDEFLYIRFRTKGGFSETVSDTPDIYGIRISNPKTDITHETLFSEKIWEYIPPGQINQNDKEIRKYIEELVKERERTHKDGNSGLMNLYDALLHAANTGMIVFNASPMEYSAADRVFPQGTTGGNTFMGKVALEQLGMSKGDSVRLLLMTMRSWEYRGEDTTGAVLFDCSHYLVLNLAGFSYVVK